MYEHRKVERVYKELHETKERVG